MFRLFILNALLLLNVKSGLDVHNHDYYETETEYVSRQWDIDEKKWFSYIFDPHYDVVWLGLLNGGEIPSFGYNTDYFNVNNFNGDIEGLNKSLFESLIFAYRLGYRYILGTYNPNNKTNLGIIAQSASKLGIKMTSLYIGIKFKINDLYNNITQSIDENDQILSNIEDIIFDSVLKNLETKEINLCIIDGPNTLFDDEHEYNAAKLRRLIYHAFEALKNEGICLNIATANFELKHLKEIFSYAKHKPVINFAELHPYYMNQDLIKFCSRKHVLLFSNNVVINKELLKENGVRNIAKKYSKTPQQIILKWALQHGFGVLIETNNKNRIAQNAMLHGWEMHWNDISLIDKLSHKNERFNDNFDDVNTIDWKSDEYHHKMYHDEL